jgi:hypothetical protein
MPQVMTQCHKNITLAAEEEKKWKDFHSITGSIAGQNSLE